MFLDPTWLQRLAIAYCVLVLPSIFITASFASSDSTVPDAVSIALQLSSFAVAIYLYARYIRISRTLVLEDRDLPLPAVEPFLVTLERAILLALFGVLQLFTMIPLLAITVCPVILLTVELYSGNDDPPEILRVVLLTVAIGAVFGTYQLIGMTDYIVTTEFGKSLNPMRVFRLLSASFPSWLLSAFVSISLALVNLFLAEAIRFLLPVSGRSQDIVATLLLTPISIYSFLVGFHLAGQAYRNSQQIGQRARSA